MGVKNKEVEEAKERAHRMVEEAEKTAQDNVERKIKDEDRKTKAVLQTMPKQAQTNEASAQASGDVTGIESQINKIRE